ncbi:MAG: YARHG domain-containing protein [Eubacteriales bacterium]|nr:YARHG domain-containing protein [Eubacteriales bacterium]
MKKRFWIELAAALLLVVLVLGATACEPEVVPTPTPTPEPVVKQNIRYIEDVDTREYRASDEEFKTMKADKIRLIACEIEALKGKIFDDEALQSHFSAMEWYTPNENYSEEMLSETAKKNLFVFKTMYDIKNRSYTEVSYHFSFDFANGEGCGLDNENVTITAAEDKKSFTIAIEGIRYTPDESGATPVRDTITETVQVQGELTGRAYIAALQYQSGTYQIVVESKDGERYYDNVIGYYLKASTKRDKTKMVLSSSFFIGNINNPEEVSFFLPSGTRRVDTFVAMYASEMFADFVHPATLTIDTNKFTVTLKKAEMNTWGKEFKVLADINVHVSKLDKTTSATAHAGETWKVLECDDDGLMILCKADDENVKGYLEFTSKGKAIVEYQYDKGTEKKVAGDKLSAYFEGIMIG